MHTTLTSSLESDAEDRLAKVVQAQGTELRETEARLRRHVTDLEATQNGMLRALEATMEQRFASSAQTQNAEFWEAEARLKRQLGDLQERLGKVTQGLGADLREVEDRLRRQVCDLEVVQTSSAKTLESVLDDRFGRAAQTQGTELREAEERMKRQLAEVSASQNAQADALGELKQDVVTRLSSETMQCLKRQLAEVSASQNAQADALGELKQDVVTRLSTETMQCLKRQLADAMGATEAAQDRIARLETGASEAAVSTSALEQRLRATEAEVTADVSGKAAAAVQQRLDEMEATRIAEDERNVRIEIDVERLSSVQCEMRRQLDDIVAMRAEMEVLADAQDNTHRSVEADSDILRRLAALEAGACAAKSAVSMLETWVDTLAMQQETKKEEWIVRLQREIERLSSESGQLRVQVVGSSCRSGGKDGRPADGDFSLTRLEDVEAWTRQLAGIVQSMIVSFGHFVFFDSDVVGLLQSRTSSPNSRMLSDEPDLVVNAAAVA